MYAGAELAVGCGGTVQTVRKPPTFARLIAGKGRPIPSPLDAFPPATHEGFAARTELPKPDTAQMGAATLLAFLIFFMGSSRASAETKPNPVENSVVKVFSSARFPDLTKPWTKRSPFEMSASGIVIEGKRILCNAHSVLYASQVQV